VITEQAPADSRRWTRRIWLAAVITACVLAVAVAAGLRFSASFGPLIAVEFVSAHLAGLFYLLGTHAPLGYAVLAGMVASVNPCGFVLLPAYVGYYVSDEQNARPGWARLRRALAVSAAMTVSFALLFGLAGILAGIAATALASSLPWVGTAVGAGLILLGGVVAAGGEVRLPAAPRVAQRLAAATRIRGVAGYATYGVAYGLASLGCTLPVFLAVVATSLQDHGIAAALGQFALFGLGMGVVVTAVTLTTAWVGGGAARRATRASRYAGWASAIVLWLAGAYVVYYWLTFIALI
jgi:cytochrome c biogenesis protein CcdA